MNTMQRTFHLTALSAALMAVFGSVQAQEVDELIKPDSSVSVGIGNWTGDRHQQGIYDGMRESGVYGLVDADIVKRDDATGTWMKLNARNLGLETREIRGEYLRQGDIGVSLEYSKTPRDNPFKFTTRLQDFGRTTQVVSSNASPLPLRTVRLGTDREAVSLGFYKNLAPGLDFKADFKNEEKNGWRHWGRGSAAEFAMEPINSTTRQFETTLSYATKKFQITGGYYGSWYSTRNDMVTMFSGTLGNAPTYLSLPLDNQAHQLYLNGGYSFTSTTRATFKLSYSHATQDERLPTQSIPGLSFAGSPHKLDGEINTTLIQLGLTSRPMKDLSLVANLRYHNVEDETPVRRFVQGALGTCTPPPNSEQCVDNTPMSYKTLSAKLEGTYRLGSGYSVTAGAEERRQDRKFPVSNAFGAGGTDNQRVVPMRKEVDETTWRLELRRSMSETLNGSVSYLRSDRRGSSYTAAGFGPGGAPSDLINPINIADRVRDKLRLAVDWAPIERLSLQASVEEGRDRYDTDSARPFGLDKGTARLFSLDATYTLSDDWQINAWYSHDHSEAKQLTNWDAAGPTATKEFKLEDTGNSLGVGVRGEVTSRIRLGGDLQWTRIVSKYNQALSPSAAALPANFSADLPDIENKLIRLSFFTTYAIDKQSDVRVDLIHERWETDDWSWMFADGTPFSYGTTTDGTTVTAKARQISNFVGVRYIYNFQ